MSENKFEDFEITLKFKVVSNHNSILHLSDDELTDAIMYQFTAWSDSRYEFPCEMVLEGVDQKVKTALQALFLNKMMVLHGKEMVSAENGGLTSKAALEASKLFKNVWISSSPKEAKAKKE
jgi:hypothetical protein